MIHILYVYFQTAKPPAEMFLKSTEEKEKISQLCVAHLALLPSFDALSLNSLLLLDQALLLKLTIHII